ncbi:hypothetical protein K438DRAFT_1787657 [Mycena galopus ATCC 62051]|nr:hypothetical protein K438DRAFT_1787657 [Mycena galopus ATCC 62051]
MADLGDLRVDPVKARKQPFLASRSPPRSRTATSHMTQLALMVRNGDDEGLDTGDMYMIAHDMVETEGRRRGVAPFIGGATPIQRAGKGTVRQTPGKAILSSTAAVLNWSDANRYTMSGGTYLHRVDDGFPTRGRDQDSVTRTSVILGCAGLTQRRWRFSVSPQKLRVMRFECEQNVSQNAPLTGLVTPTESDQIEVQDDAMLSGASEFELPSQAWGRTQCMTGKQALRHLVGANSGEYMKMVDKTWVDDSKPKEAERIQFSLLRCRNSSVGRNPEAQTWPPQCFLGAKPQHKRSQASTLGGTWNARGKTSSPSTSKVGLATHPSTLSGGRCWRLMRPAGRRRSTRQVSTPTQAAPRPVSSTLRAGVKKCSLCCASISAKPMRDAAFKNEPADVVDNGTVEQVEGEIDVAYTWDEFEF